jgi:site-specific DNA-cytosine methylase
MQSRNGGRRIVAKKFKAVAGQVFAGGFTVGVRKHFDVLAHLEETGYGADVAELNFPKIPIITGPENWPVDDLCKEGIDFVYGNPPCAAWSPLGRSIQSHDPDWWRNDPRIACTKVHYTLLDTLKPKVWATESVTNAWTRGFPMFKELAADAAMRGYTTYIVLHNAMHVGADQHRKRVFVVFSRVKIDWTCPFRTPLNTVEKLKSYKENGRIEEDGRNAIDVKMKGIKTFLKSCPPGRALRHHYEDLVTIDRLPKGVKKFGFAVKRLHPEKPSPAMIGASFVHPVEDRFLTIGEMLHFGGFPPNFKLVGSHEARAAFLGRGVIPPVAEWLAKNVKKGIERGQKVGKKRLEVVDFLTPPGTVREENFDV